MNLEDHATLTRAMSDLATAEKAILPPTALESVVLAEFDSARRSHRHRSMTLAAAGAIAAAVACLALLRSPSPKAHADVRPAQPSVKVSPAIETSPVPPAHKSTRKAIRQTRASRPPADSNPFVAIPYTLPLDPREPVTVIRVTMPVSALVPLGLASAVPDPAAIAPAEIVVSEDGRIRALRLISRFDSEERVNP
jgi:hypothetical protein